MSMRPASLLLLLFIPLPARAAAIPEFVEQTRTFASHTFGGRAGNGIRTHYDYDDDTRRLAELEAGEFQRLSYGYDRVGNIVSLENRVPRGTPRDYGGPSSHSYSYDRLYRLTGATGRSTATARSRRCPLRS